MARRAGTMTAVTAVGVLFAAGPAAADVTVSPASVPQGSGANLSFHVTNEGSAPITEVTLKPPSNATTSLLVDDQADFIDQLNATGGDTQGMRRRASRRFTCSISAATQFIHVPEKSALAQRLNSWQDVRNDPSIRICTGPLSTQTMRAP